MPTITFSLKDLQRLVGRKISIEQLEEYLILAKADLEEYDKIEDQVKAEFNDTNLPYLWSVEGLAILLKGAMEKDTGIPKINISKGTYSIKVDPSVKKIRPYISGFVAKKGKINSALLKQMIQLQEKLDENFGRKREKIAIGIYSYENITFPVTYKAVRPESVSFIPLGFRKELNLKQILKEHPKGEEYSRILENFSKYPLLVDKENKVLSFPPIINSNHLGKVEENSTELFFEATGTDEESVHLVTNIFAQALFERGFEIHSVEVKYPKKVITPFLFKDKISLDTGKVKDLLGLDLSQAEIKKHLQKMRYDIVKNQVLIPHFRKDIMHQADVIEDIAISYGFSNIQPEKLESYTIGSTLKINNFLDKAREVLIGLGYQESYSQILSNKNLLYNKMESQDTGTVEIQDYMSERYSVIRTSILPILMNLLSKNKHVEYPHRVFEQGPVTSRNNEEITDHEKIAAVTAHEKSDFTEIKQVLDSLFSNLGLEYEIEEIDNDSFIEGRAGKIIFENKEIGVIGEISPQVLENFNISVPVAALELNLSELFNSINN